MDIIYAPILIISGFFIPYNFNKKLKRTDIITLNRLWLLHLVTCIYYYFFSRNGRADAWGYWIQARRMNSAQFIERLYNGTSTEFIQALNYIPANIMGMSFFVNSLLFGLLGFIAFILLYCICIDTIPNNSMFLKHRLFPLLLFLPSLHIWSSLLGKDTLIFLCIIMFVYGLMHISKRFLIVIIALLLSYRIRPHITLLLGVSFAFTYIINGKISVFQRVFFLISLVAIAVYVLPTVLQLVRMDEVSIDEFRRFSENQAYLLSRTAGSAVNISSYSYPLKILTFVFRPFFFDINGLPALIASFENLLLVLLSIQVIKSRFFVTFKAAPLVIQGFFIFFILGTLAFSMSMSNLGIILRQRNMFLPGLILFILWSRQYQQNILLKTNKRQYENILR